MLKDKIKSIELDKDLTWDPLLNKETIKNEITHLQENFVFAPIDKSACNMAMICKRFYVSVFREELLGNADKKEEERTDTIIDTDPKTRVEQLIEQQKHLGFDIAEEHKNLARIYWTAKMHKTPPGYRFIASSSKCVTKNISHTIGFCLKTIMKTLQKKDDYNYRNKGYRRFWVVNSSDETIDMINRFQDFRKNKINNVNTYDFTTLYTMIDHTSLKAVLKRVIKEGFAASGKDIKFLVAGGRRWAKERGKGKHTFDEEEVSALVNFLVDNIYVEYGDQVFRQSIGIPMGTDCAPFLANLYLYGL
jgi:hypothetical protein